MLQPQQLIEEMLRRVKERRERASILGYWYRVYGGRRDYADQIRKASSATRIVPLVVSSGFVNVNELLADLSKLIRNNEPAFHGVAAATSDDPIILLLLSHGEFQLAQVASPAALPDWFPGLGGCEVSVWIEDITWTAEVPANAPVAKIDELCEGIYDLDLAITERQTQNLRNDHQAGSGWFAELKKCTKKTEDYAQHLATAREALAKVANHRNYRLDLKQLSTPLACSAYVTSKTAPDALGTFGQLLTRLLGFSDSVPQVRRGLLAILESTTNPDTDQEKLFGRNLLLTSYAAHRFITISAHADQYPRLPFELLRSVSFDLRVVLHGSCESLRT